MVMLVCVLMWANVSLFSQTAMPELPDATQQHEGISPAIMDNSFYIEEAFNQEPGVVQHVFTLDYLRSPERWHGLGFTQEWPLWGQQHQLSYTLTHASFGGGVSGVGDIILGYRYQLMTEDNWAASAPTFAIAIPTGDKQNGLGAGVVGFEVKLPVSKALSRYFITHWNIGSSILPGIRDDANRRHTLVSYSAGASLIWLASPAFNLMLESLVDVEASLDPEGRVVHETQTIVNPGARAAIDVGTLQIIPGIAAPVRFSGGEIHGGVFVYLSFEHPF